MPDLGPSLQVPEPTVLVEVADQVYENVLRKEVHHILAPRDSHFVKVHHQVSKNHGVPEVLQGFLQVRQVLHC